MKDFFNLAFKNLKHRGTCPHFVSQNGGLENFVFGWLALCADGSFYKIKWMAHASHGDLTTKEVCK